MIQQIQPGSPQAQIAESVGKNSIDEPEQISLIGASAATPLIEVLQISHKRSQQQHSPNPMSCLL